MAPLHIDAITDQAERILRDEAVRKKQLLSLACKFHGESAGMCTSTRYGDIAPRARVGTARISIEVVLYCHRTSRARRDGHSPTKWCRVRCRR
jgi:hypothetical protein